MPQSFVPLHYHLIFSTQNRLPTLTAALAPRLYDYLGGILRAEWGVLVAAGRLGHEVNR